MLTNALEILEWFAKFLVALSLMALVWHVLCALSVKRGILQ